MLFVGLDWGEVHHDLCLLDQDGRVLAARRIADGLAGVGELHALMAAHAQDPAQVAVGIETDRGAGGVHPPGDTGHSVARGPAVQVGQGCREVKGDGTAGLVGCWIKRRRRRHRPAGEVGRML